MQLQGNYNNKASSVRTPTVTSPRTPTVRSAASRGDVRSRYVSNTSKTSAMSRRTPTMGTPSVSRLAQTPHRDHAGAEGSGAATNTGDPLQSLEVAEDDTPAGQQSEVKDYLRVYEVFCRAEAADDDVLGTLTGYQRFCRKVAGDNRFEYLVSVMILLDITLLVIEVDNDDGSPYFFGTVNVMFALFFATELTIRAIAGLGRPFDKLLFFEATLLLISVVDLLIRHSVSLTVFQALRASRLVRVVRITKAAERIPALHLLAETIRGAFQPLVLVATFATLLIFAFALLTTILVPVVAEDSEEVRRLVVHAYGSLPRSAFSLVEAMIGCPDWGMDLSFALYDAMQDGKVASFFMLVAIFGASFVLFLALSGLVTGVFLNQLFDTSGRDEQAAAQASVHKTHECLRDLDLIFGDIGFVGDDHISFPDIQKALDANHLLLEELDISMHDVRNLFLNLVEDDSGFVKVGEFVFGLFKLKAMSRSVDMLSVDYQQEKSLARIGELNKNLRQSVAVLQSRLSSLYKILPAFRKDLSAVDADIGKVQELEKTLTTMRARGAAGLTEDDLQKKRPNIEELRSNHDLNARLKGVEDAMERLAGTTEVDAATIGIIADGLVSHIRTALHEEIMAARAGGATWAPGWSQVVAPQGQPAPQE